MSKSELVKIGVPPAQAEGMRRLRQVRQILDQRDAAVARLDATTQDRIRELLTATDAEIGESADESVAAGQ